MERYEEALVSYERALEYNPHDYWGWYRRGDALDALGRYEDALASYDKALENEPTDYWAWCQRSLMLRQLERYEEAIALNPGEYRSLAKTDSDFDKVRGNERFNALLDARF